MNTKIKFEFETENEIEAIELMEFLRELNEKYPKEERIISA